MVKKTKEIRFASFRSADAFTVFLIISITLECVRYWTVPFLAWKIARGGVDVMFQFSFPEDHVCNIQCRTDLWVVSIY